MLFLIDAIGACVSILCLCFLNSFEHFFGVPKSVLSIFICVAIVLASYSFICFFTNPSNWRIYLVVIAILNIIYCIFTIYTIIQHADKITFFGYVYFIAELIIILILCFYEIKFYRKISN